MPVTPEASEGIRSNFADPKAYAVDGRGISYSMAFFSTKHLDAGQYYLMTIVDKDGQPFDGAGTYRLTVPPNAPGQILLVGDSLRSRDPRPHSRFEMVHPRVQHTRAAEERRRIGRCLLRSQSAWGKGIELGAH